RYRHYTLATIAFSFALLCKPTAAAIPLMAAVLDRFWYERPTRRGIAALAPWFILAAIVAIVTKLQQTDAQLEFVPPLWARPFVATDALTFYLGKFFAPLRLAFDYGRRPVTVMQSGWFYLSWLVP